MSDKSMFRNKEEELQHLTQEIADIKSVLKEISTAVGRIERHVKRSFGVPEKARSSEKQPSSHRTARSAQELPTMTSEGVLSLFDDLSVTFHNEGSQEVEKKLQSISVPDLKLIAHELGISFSTKPSRKTLYSGIIGRLNERAMLSRNVNVTPSQKEQIQKEKKESPE